MSIFFRILSRGSFHSDACLLYLSIYLLRHVSLSRCHFSVALHVLDVSLLQGLIVFCLWHYMAGYTQNSQPSLEPNLRVSWWWSSPDTAC